VKVFSQRPPLKFLNEIAGAQGWPRNAARRLQFERPAQVERARTGRPCRPLRFNHSTPAAKSG